MQPEIKSLIEKSYGLKISSVTDAPRSFVAETYFIETDDAQKYFVKTVAKPLFISQIISSLPVQAAMFSAGIDRIACPQAATDGSLFLKKDDLLVILFNVIDAKQSYDYDEASLGELLGKVHKITPQIKVVVPKEDYNYVYQDIFTKRFEGTLAVTETADVVVTKLKSIFIENETRIRRQLAVFNQSAANAAQKSKQGVITHGDSGGNVLVKSREDIYLIDWDEVLLAPAERDIWVLEKVNNFLAGYRRIFPDFQPDPDIRNYYILKYYFNSFAQYLGEIFSDMPETDRLKNTTDFENYLTKGWTQPYLRSIGV